MKYNLCDFLFNESYTRIRSYLLQLKGEGVRSYSNVAWPKLVEFTKLDNI